jgi:hypothetical protein
LERRDLLDVRLSVIRADDDGVAVEERVRAARRRHELPDRRVGAGERVERGGWTRQMGGVVEVGEIEEEEVEAVARHEPAPHDARVGVRRALEPGADRERRARRVRLEEVEEEEALRPVHRLVPAVPGREEGKANRVARPAPIARHVDRGRR